LPTLKNNETFTVYSNVKCWKSDFFFEEFLGTFLDTKRVELNAFIFSGMDIWTSLDEIVDMMSFCREIFPVVDYCNYSMPSFMTGEIGILLCSKCPVSFNYRFGIVICMNFFTNSTPFARLSTMNRIAKK
jgi:hypothetical protein